MKYDGMRIKIRHISGICKLVADRPNQIYHISYPHGTFSTITVNDEVIEKHIKENFYKLVDAPRLMLLERLRREKT